MFHVLPVTVQQEGPFTLDALKEKLRAGRNILIQGWAGSGKSTFVTKQLLAALKEIHGDDCIEDGKVLFCGTSGSSALNIGGRTVHSVTGVNYGNGTPDKLWEDLHESGRARVAETLTKAKVLLLDEAFMFSGRMFDLASSLSRMARDAGGAGIFGDDDSDKPFGGLQVIIVLDMLQLGPGKELVGRNREREATKLWEAGEFHRMHFVHVLMPDHSHRHAQDPDFFANLRELAVRKFGSGMSTALTSMIAGMQKDVPWVNDAVLLTGGGEKAQLYNNEQLRQLGDHVLARTYSGVNAVGMRPQSGWVVCDGVRQGEGDTKLGAKVLNLKVGAKVIAAKRISPVIPTGTRGTVVAFSDADSTTFNMEWCRDERFCGMAPALVSAALQLVNNGDHGGCSWPIVEFVLEGGGACAHAMQTMSFLQGDRWWGAPGDPVAGATVAGVCHDCASCTRDDVTACGGVGE